jgi:S-adenosylmethionine synthetase
MKERNRAMATHKRLFTSEGVTEGHPDKVADAISDAVLDAILAKDPNGRVACETLVLTGQVHVAGEITTSCYIDIPRIVRSTIRNIGYTDAKFGFDADTCGLSISVDEQSPDIAQGVDKALEVKEGSVKPKTDAESLGAGDQGMMFGFACRETPELMPLPIVLAHRLTQTLAAVRKQGVVDFLRPDGKAQVTVEYDGHKPVRVDTIVVSAQHADGYGMDVIRDNIRRHVIDAAIDGHLIDKHTKIYINPTGRFVIGGPLGDAGLTGRKIIADTYGGMARHGGGAFSGKDPTKVDRSAAYAARYAAKNIVAAGLADRCEIQVAYAIGVATPVSVYVDTFGTNRIDEWKIGDLVASHVDLRPGAIIERFKLRRPIYSQVSNYGHFGRPELDLPWERVDLATTLREAAGIKLDEEKFPNVVLS